MKIVDTTTCLGHQNEKMTERSETFFKIGIHSMQDRTTRHVVTRKRSTKRLKHTGNLFTKNQQLIGVR